MTYFWWKITVLDIINTLFLKSKMLKLLIQSCIKMLWFSKTVVSLKEWHCECSLWLQWFVNLLIRFMLLVSINFSTVDWKRLNTRCFIFPTILQMFKHRLTQLFIIFPSMHFFSIDNHCWFFIYELIWYTLIRCSFLIYISQNDSFINNCCFIIHIILLKEKNSLKVHVMGLSWPSWSSSLESCSSAET